MDLFPKPEPPAPPPKYKRNWGWGIETAHDLPQVIDRVMRTDYYSSHREMDQIEALEMVVRALVAVLPPELQDAFARELDFIPVDSESEEDYG